MFIMKFDYERLETLTNALNKVDKVNLVELPTPLYEAKNLSKVLEGPRIFFKREDLTGLAFGGNKSRMFEFVLGKVLKEGHDVVVSGAAVQSNYCRQLSAACAKLSLELYLILRPVRGKKDYNIQGNVLLDLLAGAHVKILEEGAQKDKYWDRWRIEAIGLCDNLRKEGRNPYITRPVNETDIGFDSCAYVACMIELCEQLTERKIDLDYIYLASSDTTLAGLLFAAEYINAQINIRAMNPFTQDFGGDFLKSGVEEIVKIGGKVSEVLGLNFAINPKQIFLNYDYVGEGYGIITKECREAIKLVAQTEGIFLDPVYTGKAMAGLIDHIKKGKLNKDNTIVFIHTGGNPALFAYSDELELSL